MASLADRGLSSALVDDEHKGVLVLNRLDGTLGAERVLDDGELVPSGLSLHGFLQRNGAARLGLGLGQSERDLVPNLGLFGGMGTLLNS